MRIIKQLVGWCRSIRKASCRTTLMEQMSSKAIGCDTLTVQGQPYFILLAAGLSLPFAGAVEVKGLAQGALRQFTQWPGIEHTTFQLGGGHLQ